MLSAVKCLTLFMQFGSRAGQEAGPFGLDSKLNHVEHIVETPQVGGNLWPEILSARLAIFHPRVSGSVPRGPSPSARAEWRTRQSLRPSHFSIFKDVSHAEMPRNLCDQRLSCEHFGAQQIPAIQDLDKEAISCRK